MICRSWCALFILWLLWLCLFFPVAIASDSGLTNPAERDFGELRTDMRNTGNFAHRTPAFNDRVLPTPERTMTPERAETIQQVSAFGEATNDPFPVVSHPMPLHAGQPIPFEHSPFDWGAHAPVNPNAFAGNAFAGHVDPHFAAQPHFMMQDITMQDMHTMYLAQQQFAQQQFAQQQLAQHPMHLHQGHAMHQEHMMPFANPFMDPHTAMYIQHGLLQHGHSQHGYIPHGFADPHGMWGHPMGHQAMPDHSTMYQAFLLQEMARQQAEAAQARANNERNHAEAVNTAELPAEPQWSMNNLVPVRITSPLGETLLEGARIINPFTTPPGPDKGVGMPLANRSWLDHPWYFGGFVGCIAGSRELVSGMIEQRAGGTGGFMFGYNFNDYWGLESRVHFASIEIRDTDYARQFFETNFMEQFPGMTVPTLTTRRNQLTILDAAVHYYPLGNAKWRPYFKYGLGVGRQRFVNTFGFEEKSDIVTMPLGVGVRYWWNERLAIQADLLNNVVFASGIAKTQHNVSFTVGLTYAFGSGRQRTPIHYWPATPSMGARW